MALLLPYNGKVPQIGEEVFLAPTAVLIGDVRVGAGASIWFGAVLRADSPDHPIIIGAESSIQDNVVLHVGRWGPTVIGPRVTVGHGAVLESCDIGEGSLVGTKAVVLPRAVVEKECLLAAGTVVLEDALIPSRSLVAGVPGKVVRSDLEGSAAAWVDRSWKHYKGLAQSYREQGLDRGRE